MKKTIFYFAIVLLLTACNSEPTSSAATTASSTDKPSAEKRNSEGQSAGSDQSDSEQQPSPEMLSELEKQRKEGYGKLITGEWQAVTDASWMLKIEGTKLTQSKNDSQPTSKEFTIHVKCNQGGCFSEYFWCITTDSDCFVVRSVDAKYLNIQFPNNEVVKFVKL